MACLQIYQKLLLLVTFPRVHSNSKDVSYLPWQNTYPNLKTTCHIKLKFFLWTKLLENLLLAKYLISVTTPLISDIIEIAKIKKNKSFFSYIEKAIEKAFDSLDHNFLISALEKYGLSRNFISWVKILLKNQESCS